MIKVNLTDAPIYRILCLGAHSDDIEIGCGGTVLTLVENRPDLAIEWVVFSSDQERAHEALEGANAFLRGIQKKHVAIHTFRDGFFPHLGGAIKEQFEQLKRKVSPDVVLTHYRGDLHQDHRLIAELTWNTFRDHLILEYEIPKYDGDFGSPNVFVPLDESVCRRKIQYILESFNTQREKNWFSAELFLSVLRVRGMESNAPNKYAEAFYCRKLVLGVEDARGPQDIESRR